ncbi:helix-turn-helix domain-containing protein [Actinomadura macrotermitis]|uniref:HTH cro/C1-type domain-containing protein n=1 Tax=Actinomadura macrotermitis TaxID=2585200 RepID=A0A7K0BQJ2_9ACTN|nr:helix-turn-helix transcriptional regulator [Actinomadura macrotermitis]MQY03445.1 hypothetical protein [Actinomadura macrotermitis]
MGRPPKDLNPDESFAKHYGWKIRTLRERKGWSQEELARELNCGNSQVSRLELGETSPDKATAKLLDNAFATDYFTEHQEVVSRERIPQAARSLAKQEERARVIQAFMPTLVVGLLQIEPYIRALAGASTTPHLADEIVDERLRRQKILQGEAPVRLNAIMDYAALTRQVGGPEILSKQLEALKGHLRQRNIRIQVVPERMAAYAGLSGGFMLIEPHRGPRVAWQEGVAGSGRIIEDLGIVQGLEDAYDLIRTAALPADETERILTKIQESL